MAPWKFTGENHDEQSSPHWQIPVFDGKYRDPTRDGSYTTSRFLSPRMTYPSLCLFHGNNTGIRPLMSLHYLADEQNKNRGYESTNILRVHRPRWKMLYIYIYMSICHRHPYICACKVNALRLDGTTTRWRIVENNSRASSDEVSWGAHRSNGRSDAPSECL